MRFAVISIKPQYVEAIVEGQKVYELRRRKPHLDRGDLLFIYETSPCKKVTALVELDKIIDDSLDNLWEKVGERSAVNYDTFTDYFKGCKNGYALQLKNVKTYSNPLSLDELRMYAPDYTPPQFFHYLDEQHPLYACLTGSL